MAGRRDGRFAPFPDFRAGFHDGALWDFDSGSLKAQKRRHELAYQQLSPMPHQVLSQSGGLLPIDRHPDQCPVCHSKVVPVYRIGNVGAYRYNDACFEAVYSCPNSTCNEFFIAYFRQSGQPTLELIGTRPVEPVQVSFDESIRQISPAFCSIYEEAHKAEQFCLTEICGVGYRKSLEFLIKDYLITNNHTDSSTIEVSALGKCIEQFLTDPRIKEVAKRAAWLGNDETHYQRRWLDKDLNDLKMLIKLTLHWIGAEYLTQEALSSMPPSGP